MQAEKRKYGQIQGFDLILIFRTKTRYRGGEDVGVTQDGGEDEASHIGQDTWGGKDEVKKNDFLLKTNTFRHICKHSWGLPHECEYVNLWTLPTKNKIVNSLNTLLHTNN